MKKWKWDADGFEAICECGRPLNDMKLTMTYVHGLACLDIMPTKLIYGGHEDYTQVTKLKCDCGIAYKEKEDYVIRWTEQDYDWIWTLEVEMEKGVEDMKEKFGNKEINVG